MGCDGVPSVRLAIQHAKAFIVKNRFFDDLRAAASDGVSGNTSSEPTTESAKKMSLRRKRLFLRLLVIVKLTLRKTPAKTGAEFQKKQDNL